MAWTVLLFVLGCTVLLVGSWLTVRAVVGVAARLNLSPTLVGMTLLPCARVAAPVLAAIVAAIGNHPNAALGILVGTLTASAALPTGIACLFGPLKPPNVPTRIAFVTMLCVGAAVLLIVLQSRPAESPRLDRTEGVLLLGGGVIAAGIFFLAALRSRRGSGTLDAAFAEQADWPVEKPGAWVWLRLLLGTAVIIGGAVVTVEAAHEIVGNLQLARGVISATAVGAVLSLPQILTVFRNAILGDPGVMLSQIGSATCFGMLAGLGICAWFEPLTITHQHTYALACFACVCIGVGIAAMVRSRLAAAVTGVLLLTTYAWFAFGMLRMNA